MNRQQRRNRQKLTRTEWSLRMVELRKKMQPLPDDMSIAQLLMGIIVDEQMNISEMNLATLVGMACGFMEKAMQQLPPARHVDENGKPVYRAQELAEFTGMSEVAARESIQQYLQEAGESGHVLSVSPDRIKPLH